jgi:hypothetical protein
VLAHLDEVGASTTADLVPGAIGALLKPDRWIRCH